MTLIQEALQKAQTECDSKGLRLTEKRRNILKMLLDRNQPMSAYDISEQYKSLYAYALSAMSAYRMLEFLQQAGLVHKLETTNQYLACSHITCSHKHRYPQFLICDSCHQVIELGLQNHLMNEIDASIEKTGFKLSGKQIELHGECKQCQQNK